MGSKNSTPAPDPQLVQAQIKSMGYQDDMVQRMIANSDAMLPLQQEQTQFGIMSSKQAYEDSRADRSWMLNRRNELSGMQDQLISDAKGFDLGERTAQLKGEAYADVNSAFSNARSQGMRTMNRMGVNPNSGKALAMDNSTSLAQASALASASHKVNQAARAEGYALTDRAVNALAGYPAMGMSATGASASYGASGLTVANAGLGGMNSGYGAAGSMAGQMGQNATSMYGQQASAYNQAQSSNNEMTGSLIGAGVTAAVAI